MLWDQGASFFDFKGIVWNGANKAAIGYDHYEDKTHRGEFVTGAVHRLCAYINFKVAGFRVGGEHTADGEALTASEVQYQHLQFRNSFYGIYARVLNDLDNRVIGCHFQDHQLASSSRHGNFYCMDTRFERSNVTDIYNGGFGCNGCSLWRSVFVNPSSCKSTVPLYVL